MDVSVTVWKLLHSMFTGAPAVQRMKHFTHLALTAGMRMYGKQGKIKVWISNRFLKTKRVRFLQGARHSDGCHDGTVVLRKGENT